MLPIPRTLVHQLNAQAEKLSDRPALWTKRAGTWVPTSWRDYAKRVKQLSLALIELGLQPKQAVAIIGFNREEWVVSALATVAAGGVPVGLYTTSSPEQLTYILGHCEAPIMVVENEQYLAAVEGIRSKLPALKHLVVMDPPAELPPGTLRYQALVDRGAQLPDAPYFERLEAAKPEDLASLIYTSGTTGHPKGVMLSHRNITWTMAQLAEAATLNEGEIVVSYLPLSHIAEQTATIAGPLMVGVQVYFAESFEKLGENLKEVRPTVFFGVPRVWEKFKAKAEAGIATQPRTRQRILSWAREVGLRFHRTTLEHRQPSLRLAGQYALAKRLVFGPLKARIGLDRCRVLVTSAAPIAKDVLEFFASIDLVVRELYGQSEVTGPTSVNTEQHTRIGTLGKPLQGVAVRIADDGEILVKGENVCLGYYKDVTATAELLEGGWLHSGDVGEFDPDGFLRITGRKKEIIVTSGGKKTPPATLENLLKGIGPIGHALVVGDNKPYLVALLTLDPEKLEPFARQQGLPSDANALAAEPRFRSWLEQQIDAEVNTKVARFETIKHFVILPEDFSVETGELTPTLKVRRKVCEKKFEAQIGSLYASGGKPQLR